MVTSIMDSHSAGILAGLSPQQATPSASTESFNAQLTSALEGHLAHTGNNLIDVQPAPSQDFGVRQFLATAKGPDSAPGQTAAAAATPSGSAPAAAMATSTDGPTATFLGFVSVPASAPAATATSTTPTDTTSSTPANTTRPASTMTEVDAYWAAQPAAVQQLRNIPDLADRSAMAQQLADQGYTIDKAIMVWGWDPMKTMQTRQMYGYTWAPSWNQGNVSTPGITIGGQTAYDPNDAPAGSIAVNTDFANGPGVTNPWA
jgi:hypothetical protein